MNIIIKRISKNESHLVVDLFNKYRIFYKQPSDIDLATKYIRDRLENDESIIYVAFAKENNQEIPVGFTQVYANFSSVRAIKNWTLNDLYVEQNYRKFGIGEMLINSVKELALSTNAKKIELSTAVDNITAQGLYEKIGFERQATDNEFYTYILQVKQ